MSETCGRNSFTVGVSRTLTRVGSLLFSGIRWPTHTSVRVPGK